MATRIWNVLCGYKTLRIALLIMNCIYVLLSLLLIALLIPMTLLYYSVAVAAPVGLVAVVLFIIAVLGIVGVVTHHQVVLFFYMILLSIAALLLMATSIAAAVFANSLTGSGFVVTWQTLTCDQKTTLQNWFDCCGLSSDYVGDNYTDCTTVVSAHPICSASPVLTSDGHCCSQGNSEGAEPDCPFCSPCLDGWQAYLSAICRAIAAFGILFALTQVATILLSYRYRNLKDPKANPTSYL